MLLTIDFGNRRGVVDLIHSADEVWSKGTLQREEEARVNCCSRSLCVGVMTSGDTCGVSFLKVTSGVALDNTTLLWISVPSFSTTPFAAPSEPTRTCSTSCHWA